MKFNFLNNFFSSKKEKLKDEDLIEGFDEIWFTEEELLQEELTEYDKHVDFYYTNIINSLILYTYDVEELDKMTPVLIDPLTELYEELDYAFLPALFETVLRNNLIDISFKEELLQFKNKVDDIPNEIWDWNVLDTHESWENIRLDAEKLLNNMNIETREYNTDYTTIVFRKK